MTDTQNEIKSRLYNSLNLIKDSSISAWSASMLDMAPTAFWEKPSSSTGKHHPPDENQPGGQVTHTLRVCNVANHLSNMLDLSENERDILIAAAILHDICKYGLDGKSEYMNQEHPQLVEKLRDDLGIFLPPCQYTKEIFSTISQHMGRWTIEPLPTATKLGRLLHVADFIASRDNIEVKLSS
jgi:hypothetical protein